MISIAAIIYTIFIFYKTHKVKKNIDKKSKQNINVVNEVIELSSSEGQDIKMHSNLFDFYTIKSNIKYAVECFTPILKRLRNDFGKPIFLAEYFATPELDKWLLFMVHTELDYKEALSAFVYKNDHFVFYIILNNDLFKNEKLTGLGRIALTHEFCHLVACLISFTEMGSEAFINKVKERLTHKLNSLQGEELNNFYKILSNETIVNDKVISKNFGDEHFRLGFGNFEYNYSDLFMQLLLPFTEFKEYFSEKEIKQYISFFNENKKIEAKDIINSCIDEVAKKTDLPKNFIILSSNYYLPLLLEHNK
jgi:hypothetical protein